MTDVLTILKSIFHYFKILLYSCLATGRDMESLLVEVSPFSHVVFDVTVARSSDRY